MPTRVAQCACGGISPTTEGEPVFVVQCHCMQCQRRTGSPFGVLAYFSKENVRLAGVPKIFRRIVEGTERSVTDYFCSDCGGTVYCAVDLRPGLIGIAVGGFADAGFPAPIHSVWTQHKHEWVSLRGDIPAFPRGST